ncbi:uncharacterized protein LOC144359953, partial [Saccoglossus kowalevskii]
KKRSKRKEIFNNPLSEAKSFDSLDFSGKGVNSKEVLKRKEEIEKLKERVAEKEKLSIGKTFKLEERHRKFERQRRLMKEKEVLERKILADKMAEKEKLEQQILKKMEEITSRKIEADAKKKERLAKLEVLQVELENAREKAEYANGAELIGLQDEMGQILAELDKLKKAVKIDRKTQPDLIKSVNQSIEQNLSQEHLVEQSSMEKTVRSEDEDKIEVCELGNNEFETATHEQNREFKDNIIDSNTDDDKSGTSENSNNAEYQRFDDSEDGNGEEEVRKYDSDAYDEVSAGAAAAVGFTIGTPQTLGFTDCDYVQQMNAEWYQQ